MSGAAWRILLAALVVGMAVAAEAGRTEAAAAQGGPEEGGGAEAANGETMPEAPPAAPEAGQEAVASPEVFVPSEDISEDLSVRFPVDI